MPPPGFEPTISAGERPQTYALDCAATETGFNSVYQTKVFGRKKYWGGGHFSPFTPQVMPMDSHLVTVL